MKKDIHPKNYRLVVFQDSSCDYSFITKSLLRLLKLLNGLMGKNTHYINWRFQINLIHFLQESKI